MKLADAFVAEMTREGAGTRRTLERIPADLFGWQPHPKSMTLGRLASHVAECPAWMVSILSVDEYVLDMQNHKPFAATSTEELVQAFDANLAKAIEHLKTMSDDDLARQWRMVMGEPGCHGKTLLEMPKTDVVRTMVFNHMVHHRGQLTVYLRLNNIAVPGLYGPSADER